MKFQVERNWIDVLGRIWMPCVEAGLRIDLDSSQVRDILERDGETMREKVEMWLTTHSGDFQAVIDFAGPVGDEWIEWESEDNEMLFNDCMYGSELEEEDA